MRYSYFNRDAAVRRVSGFLMTLAALMLLSCELSLDSVVSELTVPTKFVVTYDKNGAEAGSPPVDITEYQEGTIVTVLDNNGNLEKSSYYYVGWNTKPDGSGTTYTTGKTFPMGKSNVKLYAKWTNNTVYKITYNSNGATGGGVPSDNTNYESGTIASIAGNPGILTRTGYIFTGWNTVSDGSGITYTQGSSFIVAGSDVMLYAAWSAGDSYRVIYVKNAPASGNVPVDSVNHLPGENVTVLDNTGGMVNTHYTFGGWNSADNGSGTSYSPGESFAMPGTDLYLYAVWIADACTVSFETSGGSAVNPVNAQYGGKISAPVAPTRSGYTFCGWYKETGCVNSWDFSADTLTGNITLYAKWADAVYVSASGSSSSDGLSKSSPKKTIAEGIDLAYSMGIPLVKIAQGNYNIQSTIVMRPGVSVQGGWNSGFTARDWNDYKTCIYTFIPVTLFQVWDNSIAGDIYEGFHISMLQGSAYGTSIAFSIYGSPSPVIRNNNIYVANTTADGSYIYGFIINIFSGGNAVIKNNIIRLNRENCTSTDSARAIYIQSSASGAEITIEKNKITSYSNKRSDGIRMQNPGANIVIKNNVITTTSIGSLAMAITVDFGYPYLKITNNTVYSYSVSSTGYGIYFKPSGGETYIVNNIILSKWSGSSGYGLYISSGTPNFENNLTFGFGNHCYNYTPSPTNNYYSGNGVFSNVFAASDIDSNLTDGDDTDYHINTGDSTYAYDKGMDTGGFIYGAVTDDIEGTGRPLGAYYDRGAYERN